MTSVLADVRGHIVVFATKLTIDGVRIVEERAQQLVHSERLRRRLTPALAIHRTYSWPWKEAKH